MNISLVFHLIREQGPLYRAQIAKELQLSAPAVSRAVGNLLAAGYVIETKKARTKAGKFVAPVTANADLGYVIGIDLMKEPIRVALFNFRCEIMTEHDSFKMSETADLKRELIKEIRCVVHMGHPDTDLKAICVGIPAVVNASGLATNAILYDNLKGKNLKESLEKEFNVPVYAENVANLAALAEGEYGAGKEANSFVCITIGNGIGAGVIIDRNLYRGARGFTGEIGFHLLNVDKSLEERHDRKRTVGA